MNEQLKDSVRRVTMPAEARARIAAVCRAQQALQRRRHAARRLALTAAAVAVCLALSVPSLAAGVPAVYDALYAVAPAAAQRMKPVQQSCEANGIRMEVTAASVQGSTAELCITLQDLTESRIDETTDLFDSYCIRAPFSSSATCSLSDYDAQTGTAVFLVHIEQWDGQPIRGDKVTFSLREFLSGKQHFDGPLGSTLLTDVPRAPALQTPAALRGGRGIDTDAAVQTLVPGTPQALPGSGAWLTALGFVDGKLHIQLYFEDILRTDNHGFPYLLGPDSERLDAASAVSFWDDAQQGSYEEFTFDLSPEALAGSTLCAELWTGAQQTEGPWEVTFPLT